MVRGVVVVSLVLAGIGRACVVAGRRLAVTKRVNRSNDEHDGAEREHDGQDSRRGRSRAARETLEHPCRANQPDTADDGKREHAERTGNGAC